MTAALKRVERAQRKAEVARAELDAAIVEASKAGAALRPIAAAAKLSPEWVRRTIAKAATS